MSRLPTHAARRRGRNGRRSSGRRRVVDTAVVVIAALLSAVAAAGCGGAQRTADAPRSSGPHTELAEPGGIRPRRESDLERGREALRAGRAREAVARFDRALERGEDRAAALHDRAIANLAMARHSDALADSDAAVQAGGGDTSRLLRAAIQVRLGMHALAEADLADLAERGPDEQRAQSRRLLMVSYAETGRTAEAATIARQLVGSGVGDCAICNDAGVALEIAGYDDEARDLYDRAIGADDECIEAWRNLAMLELRLDRDAAAARSLETYLRLAPFDTIDRAVMQGRLDGLRDR